MTFTEQKGHEPFDWKAALEAETPNWGDLQRRSLKWDTDPVSQLENIERAYTGVPEDRSLSMLAIRFWTDVQNHDAVSALQTLEFIIDHHSKVAA